MYACGFAHMHVVPKGPEEGAGSLGAGVTGRFELMRVQGLSSGPLDEQYAFLITSSSLQPHGFNF